MSKLFWRAAYRLWQVLHLFVNTICRAHMYNPIIQ
jgi:hypothetical protein